MHAEETSPNATPQREVADVGAALVEQDYLAHAVLHVPLHGRERDGHAGEQIHVRVALGGGLALLHQPGGAAVEQAEDRVRQRRALALPGRGPGPRALQQLPQLPLRLPSAPADQVGLGQGGGNGANDVLHEQFHGAVLQGVGNIPDALQNTKLETPF